MNSPLISIVVPVYNGEKYLKKLIESLLSQTYQNFEVLLIDDFSTDNSVETIKTSAQNTENFRIYTPASKLGTASKSIEFALPLCHGDYYFYMSQDDFIDSDCLEKCINKALSTDAEIVIPNAIFYFDNKKSKKISNYPLFNNYNMLLNQRKAFVLSLKWKIPGSVLKSMNLVKRIGIQAKYLNDDEFFTRKSYLYANKIAFANTNFYYRKDNENAITKVIRPNFFDIQTTDILLAKLLIEHKFPKHIIDKRFKELIKMHSEWINLYSEHKNNFTDEQKDYVIASINNAKNDLEQIVKKNDLILCKIELALKKLEDIK